MKYFAAFILTALAASAQTYTALYEKTTSAAAAVTSLQQPGTPLKNLHLLGVQLYCSVACVVTLGADGAASGSTSTVVATNPSVTIPATAAFYKDSNAVAASIPMNKYAVLAGTTVTVPFTDANGRSNTVLSRVAGQNLTARTDTITGDVKVTWFWRED